MTVITTAGGSSTPLASAYTYNASADGHRGQPEQRAPGRGQHGHGHRHRLHRCRPPSTSGRRTRAPRSTCSARTSLTVTVPAGTGTVDVTVTTPSGTSAATPPSDHYTYNAPPTVTVVTPNNGPQAGGNTVTVTGTGFVSGSTTVDFGATAGTASTWPAPTSLTRGRPVGDRHGLGDRDHHGRWVLDPAGRRLHLQRVRRRSPRSTRTTGPRPGATRHGTGTGFVSGSTTVDFGTNPGTSVNVPSAPPHRRRPGGDRHGLGRPSRPRPWHLGATLASAYTYNASADGHRGQPEQRATGRRQHRHGDAAPASSRARPRSTSAPPRAPGQRDQRHQPHRRRPGGDRHGLGDRLDHGRWVRRPPWPSAYTYNASTVPGGAITVAKSTALIGNYPDKVSGTGWASWDTSVTLNECASTAYSASTCDAANQVSVTLGTGKLRRHLQGSGDRPGRGVIDTNGDTCGVAGSVPCYVVVVGNTGDSTSQWGARLHAS